MAAVRGVPVVVVEISPSPLVSASQPFLNFFPTFSWALVVHLPLFRLAGTTFFYVSEATRLLGRVVFAI